MTDDWREAISLRSPTEERNPVSVDIDTLGAAGIVTTILEADSVLVERVRDQSAAIAQLADAAVTAIGAGGKVRYVGAGTSGRLGVLDAVELAPTYGVGTEWFEPHLAGGDEAMMAAVEGAEDSEELGAALPIGAHDLVIGLAASGRTPFVVGALEKARRLGAVTGLIGNNPYATLADLADIAVLVDTGPEVITGSTRMRAGSAQKIVLNTFSTAVMVRLGRTYSNLMIGVAPTNVKLRARCVRMLVQATGAPEEECARMLAETGDQRAAMIALLGGVEAAPALAAAAANPPDPARLGDPGGVRTAVAQLRASRSRAHPA
ncbi:N-acetylmuramic acid 6-phosphate etherase [Salana multivorans]